MTSTPARTPGATAWGDLRPMLLIARRGAIEALHDRLTLVMSLLFALVFPIFMVVTVIRPLALSAAADGQAETLARVLTLYLLIVGVVPSTAATGIAAGQFAGEKERGCLTPLLASPASNLAIFGGKTLGAIIPAILFSVVAEVTYLIALVAVIGPASLRLISPSLAPAMLALVPAAALFAASVASLISSRVRTYNAAQQLAGLALLPFWGALFAVAFKLPDWGPWALVAAVAVLLAVDAALTLTAAATWRREEALAQR
jgi:ABC-type transport system involved in multi-copper enzyme maturation permease subunit